MHHETNNKGEIEMTVREKLLKNNIKTISDLDNWIKKHPTAEKHYMSRFGALKILVGENAAIWMLNELAIKQCT